MSLNPIFPGDLFATTLVAPEPTSAATALNPDLHQWFTPAWAAEAIVEQEFGWLRPGHRVLEPSCGDGAFLVAFPQEVDAIGVEIDPNMAARAAKNSGREVVVGDFLSLPAERIGKVDAIVGNPPFSSEWVGAFVERAAGLLDEGGQVGLILPSYVFQTSSRIEVLSRDFSIHQQMLPRNLFPGIKLPLIFAKFIKEQHRRLFGFLLYREAQDIRELEKGCIKAVTLARDPRGTWRQVVLSTLAALGGEADLKSIYEAMATRRPTENAFWKEKVRQALQRSSDFVRTGPGRYALASA
ncbi:class I SAM-dependent methyltransferase [Hydrogenophaga sp. 2FB]|uniref:N-6 DNA methylase n=1 Tax=Hydrogenophaga sp. 2FB TaxID=2502187 RepID=UPI00207BC49B|nr:class I SAM-dependent methyltransferase [Hydrogenophaga sp. 2FB]